MTFQDRRILGQDWEKVKNKRKLQRNSDEVSANKPQSVFKQFNEPTTTEVEEDKEEQK